MKSIIVAIVFLVGLGSISMDSLVERIDTDATLSEIQEALGKDYSSKKPNLKLKGVSARVGQDIVKNGFSRRKGEKNAKRQSKHFVCTSCHNTVREDPNLAKNSPEDRLTYTTAKGLPFLQATTLYGAVNRETYYNGDYEKKYGQLVEPARNDIREAIQLCALECAQGRKLKDWELESILAYLWEIEIKIKDFKLSDAEKNSLSDALDRPALHQEGLKLLSNQYLKKSDATFLLPPPDRKVGVGLKGDPSRGKQIYNSSCLHCHYQKRYSFLHLDNRKMNLNHLDKKAGTYSRHSLYQVVRYGTYSKYGKRSYMPSYTEERMSDQQLADLRSYIATGGEM